MSYLGMSMYLQRSSLEKILPGLSFMKLEHCLLMAEIDLEFPLPLSIQLRSLCGWGIKGYIIDLELCLDEIFIVFSDINLL